MSGYSPPSNHATANKALMPREAAHEMNRNGKRAAKVFARIVGRLERSESRGRRLIWSIVPGFRGALNPDYRSYIFRGLARRVAGAATGSSGQGCFG
jgi:hypothetical protein